MGALLRAHRWERTSLGRPEDWPESLKSALSLCLDSAFPIAIYWGEELALLYNDAWRPILGDKHPWALGRPGHEVWPEIWDAIEPVFRQVRATGKAAFVHDGLLAMNRFGYTEECYFDYTLNPIRLENVVGGIFNVVIETTYRVIAERRARVQRDFGARIAPAKSLTHAISLAAEALATDTADVPFALLYRIGGHGSAHLERAVGVAAGSTVAPQRVALNEQLGGWPLAEAVRSGAPQHVTQLAERFGAHLPGGPWPEAAREALVLPISAGSERPPVAVLIAGVSPRRGLDLEYRGFLESLGAHLGRAIGNAAAFEHERRRAEALAEIDRAKTVFFSNVSHEFRTPLTLLLGPVEELLERRAGQMAQLDRDALVVVQRNGQRLLKLVNTLLDFARIEAGRAQASFEPTDLPAYTAELASTFRSACERAELTLEIDCPEAPDAAYVDREMWEKIVLNLVSNAFKFTLRGGIRVELRSGREGFELRVKDSGSGIRVEELPRMFERFHRVEGASGRSFEGSGIGLALVHELVKLHGGTIGVESEPGRGSTFFVRLPGGTAHLPAERLKARPEGTPPAAHADAFVEEALRWLPESAQPPAREERNLPRVLLADDNADLRDYARRLLAETFDVEAVADGEAALAAARAQPPDLVVSDVTMPKLDGFALLAALRADPRLRNVPVLLLSARAGEEARLEGLGKGADDYLAKPFSARELLVRASTLLRSVELRREAERSQREFLDTAPAILWVTEPDGACSYLSRGWYDFTGQSESDALGFGWTNAIHPEDQPLAARAFVEANEQRVPFSLDYRLRRADGTYRWAIDSGRPRVGAQGEFLGFVGSVIDVQERKEAEQQLRASEARYRAVVESQSEMVCRFRPSGEILFVNEAYARAIGSTAETMSARSFWDYVPAADRLHVAAMLEALTPENPEARVENRFETKDGVRWMLWTNRALTFDAAGRVREAQSTGVDITEMKRAEQALEEADRRKDEFIATLSHELRNPLAPLRNALHLLRLSDHGDSQLKSVHQMMERQVDQIVRLVDDLLEISRITRGALELRRQPIELATVVRNAVETADSLVRSAGHRLDISLADEKLMLNGDPVRLAQLLANLLNNAAHYTPRGGRIDVGAHSTGDQVTITVRDNGQGIAPEQLERVFEMFSRGQSSSGLGIGLALARRLAELHGGSVRAESAGLGRGAAFIVTLPLCGSDGASAHTPQRSSGALRRKRILVVDDNRDAANSLAMLLVHLGAEVEVAHSGQQALERIETYRPGVALLDIGMPEMDGYEVARAIRSREAGSRIPLIALTGWGQEEDRRRARAAGFDHHLVKPADIDALQRLLAAL